MQTKLVYKVVVHKDAVETVYLVSATSVRDAKTTVLDGIYDRSLPSPVLTPEELERDVFGLRSAPQELSNRGLMRREGCSIGAAPWSAEEPYRLYSLNIKTGEMS